MGCNKAGVGIQGPLIARPRTAKPARRPKQASSQLQSGPSRQLLSECSTQEMWAISSALAACAEILLAVNRNALQQRTQSHQYSWLPFLGDQTGEHIVQE